jgi:hypothetical protein
MSRRDSGTDALARVEWLVAGLVTAAALALSLWSAVRADAFFRDEVNSLNVASSASLAKLWRGLEFESAPALWLLLLRGWLFAFGGESDASLRVFALLGGLTLPAALWFAARRLGGTVPLAGLALVAVNPVVIRWATSLRAWGLGAALAVVALVWLHEATRAPSFRRIAAACGFALLSVHCVYQNAVLLAAAIAGAGVVAAAERRWRRAAVPFAVGALAALSLFVYLPTLRRIASWNMLNQRPIDLGVLAGRAAASLAASGDLVLACWLVVSLAALAASAWAWWRRRSELALFASVSAVAAVVGLALFLLRLGYLTQPWYYVGLGALVAVCADTALAASLSPRAGGRVRVAVALLVLGAGLPAAWRALGERQTNVDAVARHLAKEAQPADLIVVNPWLLAISLGRYYHGAAELTTIPPLEDLSVHRFDLVKREMERGAYMGPLIARAGRALRAGGRIWVVGGLRAPQSHRMPPTPGRPPLPDTGWSMDPYQAAWTLQFSGFLSRHATEVQPVPVEVAAGPYESLVLYVASGWR